MSEISLETVIAFPARAKPTEVILDNVDMISKSAPEGAVTFYYGFSESLMEQSAAINKAEAAGKQSSSVTVSVEVGESSLRATTPETLVNTRFLNLTNISKALEDDVQRVWKKVLSDEGIDQTLVGDKSYWRNKAYVVKNPHLVSRLREFEQFAHLDVIAYPFDNPSSQSFCKRATLFSKDHVTAVRVNKFPEIEAILSFNTKPAFKP